MTPPPYSQEPSQNPHWTTCCPIQPPNLATPIDKLRATCRDAAPQLRVFFSRAAATNTPILFLLNDPHRATLTSPALTALHESLSELQLTPRLHILFATGTHRFTPAQKSAFEQHTVAPAHLAFERIEWHDATNDASLENLAGARWNRRILNAPLIFAIGSVEPHYFAGLTGAHKTITIGTFARATIEQNHAGALHPASDNFNLDGNPVYEGLAQHLRNLQEHGANCLALNQISIGDQLVTAAIGDPLQTLHQLAPTARQLFCHEIETPADLIHLRVPHPLGRNLYQADKALKNNHRAVRNAGAILLEAPCDEGIGPDAFLNLLREATTYHQARQTVTNRGYQLGDHKAVKLRHLTDPHERNVRVALASPNVPPEAAALCGIHAFPSVNAALQWLQTNTPAPLQQALRIEDAGNMCVLPKHTTPGRSSETHKSA